MVELAGRFRPKWRQLIIAAGGQLSGADKLYQTLVAHYTGPNRHYHHLAHVTEMLMLLERLAAPTEDQVAVQLAIWFHDVIYEVGTGIDSERASADFAAEQLADLQLAPHQIDRIHQLILDTKHIQPPMTADGRLVVDADLAQLAGPFAQFERDTAHIRQEYAIYPDDVFWPGRRRVLQQFLDRDRIYHTKLFFDRFEAAARRNLTTAINQINRHYAMS